MSANQSAEISNYALNKSLLAGEPVLSCYLTSHPCKASYK